MRQSKHHRKSQFAAVAMMLLVCSAGTAQASGFGGYFEYGSVNGKIELFSGADGNVDFDAKQFGVGFVYDSNLAKDSLFNYRGTFGYRASEHTFDTTLGDLKLDADGFEMNHLFGFGIVRTDSMRIFIGPAIRIGVDVFDTPSAVDLVSVDFGIGPEIGVNLHVSDHLTLSPWVSYQYHYLVQTVQIDGLGDDSFSGSEHVVKVGMSIFFRTAGDQYRR